MPPVQRTPATICINRILPETRVHVPLLIVYVYLFVFMQSLSESQDVGSVDIPTRKMAIGGRSRSSVSGPVESQRRTVTPAYILQLCKPTDFELLSKARM